MARISQRQLKKAAIVAERLDRRLYHLSFANHDEVTFHPRIPAGTPDDFDEQHALYEPSIQRIALAPTVPQCFRAVWDNVKHFFYQKHYPHIDFYVHVPQFQGHEQIIRPTDLDRLTLVWDAFVTAEHWCLSPVTMQMIGRVRIQSPRYKRMKRVYPYNDSLAGEKRSVGPQVIQWKKI